MGRAAGVLQAPSTVHLFSFRILPRIFRSTKAESERAGSRSTAETWPFLPRFLGETVDNPVARGEESGKNTLLQASLATISHNGISERCRLEIRLESLLAVECHVGDTACGFHGRGGGGRVRDWPRCCDRTNDVGKGSQCPLDAIASMEPCGWVTEVFHEEWIGDGRRQRGKIAREINSDLYTVFAEMSEYRLA